VGSTKRVKLPGIDTSSQIQQVIDTLSVEHHGLSSHQAIQQQLPSCSEQQQMFGFNKRQSTITSSDQPPPHAALKVGPQTGHSGTIQPSASKLTQDNVDANGQKNAQSVPSKLPQQPLLVSQVLNIMQALQAMQDTSTQHRQATSESPPPQIQPSGDPTKQKQRGRVCKVKDCPFCTRDPCGTCGNCQHYRRNKCIHRYCTV
jgi:hypothetical protein